MRPRRSEQLHALVGNQLRGAGEDRLAGGEIEHAGSQAVRICISGSRSTRAITRRGSSPKTKREVLMG